MTSADEARGRRARHHLIRIVCTAALALADLGCRSRHEAAPAPGSPPATSLTAPDALPGIEPAPAVTLSDAEAYFALVEPHLERVSIYGPPAKFLAEFARTPEKPRNLLAAHWCVAEISNGGFLQLFSSSAGVLAPEALIGLRAIGLHENADLVAEAMKTLGAVYPREHKRRNRALDAAKRRARVDNPFAALDDRFFTALKRHPGGFDAVAAAYARAP